MNKAQILILFMVFCTFTKVQAEIKQITIYWPPQQCQTSCERGLEQQFRRVNGVTDVYVSGSRGQANLKWDSKTPFSYRPLEAAVAAIGLGREDIRLSVRGYISHNNQTLFLTSIGDNTRFNLMGPAQGQGPSWAIEQQSPFNRQLSQQLRDQLMETERNRQAVTITGPLFQPETSPPLNLVVEILNIEN